MITLTLERFDAGCLVPLLTREIGAVERHLRAVGDEMTPNQTAMTAVYLGQLRKTLDAALTVLW